MLDKSDKRTRLILLAVTMAALCLATIRLGYDPLWVDEAVTWEYTHYAIPEIVESVQDGPHGAFYYTVMKVWFAFGDSEFWLRSFSALCFTFTVPVVYVIGRTVSGRRAGLYAACLVATAPFLIRYAMEVRMYAMLTLFCSLALMSVALIISRWSDRPPAVIGAGLRGLWRRDAPVSRHGREDGILWAIYIVAVLGGMYSHHTALLLPVLTALIFLAAIAVMPQYRWLRLWNLIAANIALLALYAFNIPLLQRNVENLARDAKPVPIDFGWVQRTLRVVYGNEYVPEQAIVLAALFAVALWGWRRRKDWKWVGFALIGSLGLPLALLVATAVFRSVFIDRTIIWASVPFYVVCAAGLSRLPGSGLRRIVLAGLLLSSLYGVLKEYEREGHPWDQVAQILAQEASSDSAVLLCPFWMRAPFSYYWRRYEHELAIFGEQNKQWATLFPEPADGDVKKWGQRVGLVPMVSLFDDYPELWIVSYKGDAPGYLHCGLPALQDRFSGRERLAAEYDLSVILKMFAFARDDGLVASD